jgi:hypothetical protein
MAVIFVPCAVRNEYLAIAQSCYRCSACHVFVWESLLFCSTVCWLLSTGAGLKAYVIVS